jgi:hypothetical protein
MFYGTVATEIDITKFTVTLQGAHVTGVTQQDTLDTAMEMQHF